MRHFPHIKTPNRSCLRLPHSVSIRLAIFLALSHYSDCAAISATRHEAFKILSGRNVRLLAACRTCCLQSLPMIIEHHHPHASINTDIWGKRHCNKTNMNYA